MIIPFGVAVICCIISIEKSWIRFDKHPVTTTSDKASGTILDIPFPTITVCPKTKTTKDKLDLNYAFHQLRTQKQKNNLTDLE